MAEEPPSGAGVPVVDVGVLMRELGVSPGAETGKAFDSRPLSRETLDAIDALHEVCNGSSGGLIAVGHGFEQEVRDALLAARCFHKSDAGFKRSFAGKIYDPPGSVKLATRPTTLHERLRYPRVVEANEAALMTDEQKDKEDYMSAAAQPLVVVPGAEIDVDSALRSYQRCIRLLALALLRAMAIKLGLPRTYFDKGWLSSYAGITSLHYLALSGDEPASDGYFGQNVYTGQARKSDGLGDLGGSCRAYPHADGDTMLTLLCHDDVSGLQVLERGTSVAADRWLDVPRVSAEQIVVQIGQMTQRWTNDLFHATPHRVLKPSVIPSPARTTISCFFKPSLSTILEVPESLRRPNDAGYVYDSVDVATFLQLPLTDDSGTPVKLTSNILRNGSWVGVRE